MPVKVEVELCVFCGVQLADKSGAGGAQRQGLALELVHSPGGWGQRREDINFSDEPCAECSHTIRKRILEAWNAVKEERRNTNQTFVVVTNPTATKVQ